MDMTADPGLMIWTLVTFVLLLLLLSRFAFRPLRRALAEREQVIRDSLERAEQAKREAEDMLRKNEEQLGHARDEARRIIGAGQKVVADMRHETERGAKDEATAIVARARIEIDRELQKSLDELKASVAGLAVRISRQVIKENLDEQRHEQLAEDFIERLKRTYAKRPS